MNKKEFLKQVTIISDTREQENKHILSALDEINIRHESRKLDFGDYSFMIIDTKRTPNAYREFTQYEYCTTKDGEFLSDVPDKDNHKQ